MQNLNLKRELTTKSLTSFHEILSEPYSPIIRDATLLRFQRSVEIFCSLLKDYLCIHEGFVCESPKSCIKRTFKVEFMDEEETVQALEMLDRREEIKNIAEHSNFEEVAEEIYRQVGDYWKLMDEVCRRVVERVELDFPGSPEEK
ncbi:putative nucleotidyltransferase [Methanosarcina siciliae T4/M]|uniref:Putative nucleotidyltransferase n=2 Tax=Methanosarcina siciliae TaxID=38027 RepID=A0A0E3PBN9_9EURY|nr:nucleotidyltransferase substrate binding protein [Methanosarcina siciliae]AKB26789.1 putative nucleotidyltransferase [Methanosarcina siciliae T4/M]AKB30759.1 putative nucleotidyltransferase [Methanosarcina siciliae HI350]